MEDRCDYKTVSSGYRCLVMEQQIPAEVEFKFWGRHEDGKTDNDVTYISFHCCSIMTVPQGLTKKFPNLKIIKIYKSSFLKNISRSDLIEYKNLKEIDFSNNKIEFLPGNLFEGFKNLENIIFNENNLKIVEPNILDGLDKLKYVNFNPQFGCAELIKGKNLDQLKDHLRNKFFKNDLQTVKKYNEKIQSKVEEATVPPAHKAGPFTHYYYYQEAIRNQQKKDQKSDHFNTKRVDVRIPKSFCRDLQKFVQDENTKDFQIQIDEHEFPVHKFLLAARSPTLAEILKKNPEVENLNLVDISVEIFKIILKFLYTDELPGDDGTNFLQLFAAAGKLKIEELKKFAATNLFNMMDAENALEIFKIACKYDQKELKQKGFKIIKDKYPGRKFKDEWIDDAEKVEKLIAYLKKIQEAEREIEGLM